MSPSFTGQLPRLILYHQTTHDPEGNLNSILPLLTRPGISITHLIVAAIHINEDADAITLNDHAPSDPRYISMWAELRIAQASGVTVLGMLGGAAKGSYTRLDQDHSTFDRYYAPLYELIHERGLQGLDLDVEEEMSLAGIIRLIDRLRGDFGPDFIITLAPVAAALLDARANLSGFDYESLEVMRGSQIAWYNAQFYCGWGDASNPAMYEMCLARGWAPEKLVVGLVTTPENGAGFVPFELLGPNLALLRRQLPRFGGVMGWEYFNGQPGGKDRPWEWAQMMTRLLGGGGRKDIGAESTIEGTAAKVEIDPDTEEGQQVGVPESFEYFSDSSE
ncbi:glycoside hydrolase family 18 protein [Xylariomycetidae sp. FL2044]|nr:glycoside hydrolase family 18 protein [Xylariomycetidae sp. FL2044]